MNYFKKNKKKIKKKLLVLGEIPTNQNPKTNLFV